MIDTVRVAILGMAHLHANSYIRCLIRHPNAQLIGIFDPEQSRTLPHTKNNNIPYFNNCDDLLKLHPNFVIVCSENARHEEMIHTAAMAGVDVLCEKPLGISKNGMEVMLRVCEENHVRLMTAFPNRYIHAFSEAVSSIQKGELGELLAIKATNKGIMPGDWFVDPDLSGGGAMIDHTVHVADLINWLVGQAPERVRAICDRRLFEDLKVDDVAIVNFIYSSGLFVTLDSSWSRVKGFPYDRDLTLHIVGTNGSIEIDYFANSNKLYSRKNSQAEWRYYGDDKDYLMLSDLIDCYRTGRKFMIDGKAGYDSAMVAVAAYASVKLGREVFLNEL